MIDVKTKHAEYEVEVLVTADDGDYWAEVERMFDISGSETMDPTEAVEIDSDGTLRALGPDDLIVMKVRLLEREDAPDPPTSGEGVEKE